MFKAGEIVYCIEDYVIGWELSYNLHIDTPYVVSIVLTMWGRRNHFAFDSLKIVNKNGEYDSGKFMSEQDYNISKRIDKINNIRECLKKVM